MAPNQGYKSPQGLQIRVTNPSQGYKLGLQIKVTNHNIEKEFHINEVRNAYSTTTPTRNIQVSSTFLNENTIIKV
jgi:hypothetical protein